MYDFINAEAGHVLRVHSYRVGIWSLKFEGYDGAYQTLDGVGFSNFDTYTDGTLTNTIAF